MRVIHDRMPVIIQYDENVWLDPTAKGAVVLTKTRESCPKLSHA